MLTPAPTISGAHLYRTTLVYVNLNGATLCGATWQHTTCPDGTNSNHDGGTCTYNL